MQNSYKKQKLSNNSSSLSEELDLPSLPPMFKDPQNVPYNHQFLTQPLPALSSNNNDYTPLLSPASILSGNSTLNPTRGNNNSKSPGGGGHNPPSQNPYPTSYNSYSQQQQFFAQLQNTQHPHELTSPTSHSSRPLPSTTTSQSSSSSSSSTVSGAKFRLTDFTICRTLGTGSFGRVHLVQSKKNNKYYAMKVLKKSEVIRLKQVEHTNNERKILTEVNHPFLVNLWGSFQDSANLYMVMDYVCGGELFSVLRKTLRFQDNVAKFYAAEVLLAFEYLHSKDIIYRDLKPENLLLDRNGHIKITDFGFAKYVPDITWTLCGTPDYLAPEIIQSKGYGKAVDWYSLGVLIYEMLAGCPPFYDDDPMRLYEKILGGRIRYPSYFHSTAKDLLKRLLTADLTKRYGNLKGGCEDIKRHDWFRGIDWERLLRQEMQPPYIPQVSGDGDASNFDLYPEEREGYGQPCTDLYRDKFPGF